MKENRFKELPHFQLLAAAWPVVAWLDTASLASWPALLLLFDGRNSCKIFLNQ